MENTTYQVLYRKFRPRFFSDVYGQPAVTTTLKNELKSGRISHAYLFTGSRGTGKTSCAKILSKAVNCQNLKDGDPCGECEICRGIDGGTIMDVVEIDAASNNGVDNIRNLKEEISFMPSVAKYRVYIIDEVHMLSIGAFNALLKTLEEPPAHVVFILATTEVHKLPETILSRCQRFDFGRIKVDDIVLRLRQVCDKEKIDIEDDALYLIAKLSNGGMRDALSLLDQCVGKDKVISEDIVNEAAGLMGNNKIFSIVENIINGDFNSVISTLDELYKMSKDMQRLCLELIEHYRTLMLIKISKDVKELVIYSKGDYEKILAQASKLSLEEILHALDILSSCVNKINLGVPQKTELELSLVKLCFPILDDSSSAIIRRIEKLEKNSNKDTTQLGFNSSEIIQSLTNRITILEEKIPLDKNNSAGFIIPECDNTNTDTTVSKGQEESPTTNKFDDTMLSNTLKSTEDVLNHITEDSIKECDEEKSPEMPICDESTVCSEDFSSDTDKIPPKQERSAFDKLDDIIFPGTLECVGNTLNHETEESIKDELDPPVHDDSLDKNVILQTSSTIPEVKEKDVLLGNEEPMQLSFSTLSEPEDKSIGAKEMPNWQDVLNALKKYSNTIYTAFSDSKAYVNGDFVLIDAKSSVGFELLRKSAQRDKMREALKEVTGRSYKLGPYKKNKDNGNSVAYPDPLEKLAQLAVNAGIEVVKN